ncbi:MAG: hypothetical protein EHM89_00365 [Acidobacteria bacterium]|nr:MAG: hypothetical protein EHM89_00365 [Acidobacteriota bacterium]
MTGPDLSKLRALAEAAMPGEWLYSEVRGQVDTSQFALDGTLYDGVSWQPEQVDERTHAQGRFIAACSPSTVLALLDEIKRLKSLCREACDIACLQNSFYPGEAELIDAIRSEIDGKAGEK